MVTTAEIKKLASLAKLKLTDAEIEKMAAEMSSIVAFADTINSVKIDGNAYEGIATLKSREGADSGDIVDSGDGTRPDEVEDSYPRDEILRNTGDRSDGYFLIKKRK